MKLSLNTSGIVGKVPSDEMKVKAEFFAANQYWKAADISIIELADHISKGGAWLSALIDEGKRRTKAACNFAECLAVDIDNGMSMDEAIAIDYAKNYCALIIPSSSHTPDHHKFRMVFPLPYALTDREQIEAGYRYLLEVFPCGDKSCKNSDRFFYGALGAKPFHLNEEAVLPLAFFDHVTAFQEKKQKAAARDFTKFQALCDDADKQDKMIILALGHIPKREIGAGTYCAARDAIWALCSAFGESRAIAVMEQHSPSYSSWDVAKIASKFDASHGVTLGSLFWHAKQYGFSFPAKAVTKNWKPSISKKLTAIPECKGKKFFASLSNLADRRTKRTIQGLGDCASKSDAIAAYLELRGWQNILITHQDTFTEDKASDILEKLCNISHLNLEAVKADIKANYDIANLKPSTYTKAGNDGIEEHIRLWRKRYFEIDPTKDFQTEKDRVDNLLGKESEYLATRITQKARSGIKYHAKFQSWYVYKDGIYQRIEGERITALIRELLTDLGFEADDKNIKEYVNKFRDETITDRMDTAPKYLIPMLDGILDRRSMQLLPHDKKYLFTWCLPYRWSDRLKSSVQPIIDWLKSALEDDHQVRLVLCFMNMAIVGRKDIHRFLELIGAGGTGKSTLLTLFTALTGRENTRATSLPQLETNRFETANFQGKKLITISEFDKYRGTVENLKRITGRDPLRYEEKNKQCAPDFVYDGLIVMAANYSLNGEDKTSALDRRRCTLPMNKIVPKHLREHLIDSNDEGFSGKFAPCLPALIELVLSVPDKAVKDYCDNTERYVPSLNKTRKQTLIATNKIADWLENNCIFLPEAKTRIGSAPKVTVSESRANSTQSRSFAENVDLFLYANYTQFCLDNGCRPTASNLFNQELLDLCNNQLENKSIKHFKNSQGAFIQGIAIRNEALHSHLPSPISKNDGSSEEYVMGKTLANEELEEYEEFFLTLTQEKNKISNHTHTQGTTHTNKNNNDRVYKDLRKTPHTPQAPQESQFCPSHTPHDTPHQYQETRDDAIAKPLPIDLKSTVHNSTVAIEEPIERQLTQSEITDRDRLIECKELGLEVSLDESWMTGNNGTYIEVRDAKLKELNRKAVKAQTESLKIENGAYF